MHWIAGIVAYVWLTVVYHRWGFGTASLVGVSMLAVALLALWEAGRTKGQPHDPS